MTQLVLVSRHETERPIEIAYPQKIARHIIIDLARPINNHLVKLVGFDFPAEQSQHFRSQLRNWFREVQAMRLKPTVSPGSFRFYFDLFFDYPFGGIEVQNMRGLVELISREYGMSPTKSPEELVPWLEEFHTELAKRLRQGEDTLDLIPT